MPQQGRPDRCRNPATSAGRPQIEKVQGEQQTLCLNTTHLVWFSINRLAAYDRGVLRHNAKVLAVGRLSPVLHPVNELQPLAAEHTAAVPAWRPWP